MYIRCITACELHNIDIESETGLPNLQPRITKQTRNKENDTMRAELRATVKKDALQIDTSQLLLSDKAKTGYLGVSADRSNAFSARVTLNRKKTYLGTYNTAEEAAAAVKIKHQQERKLATIPEVPTQSGKQPAKQPGKSHVKQSVRPSILANKKSVKSKSR
jgi:hypothetical protein